MSAAGTNRATAMVCTWLGFQCRSAGVVHRRHRRGDAEPHRARVPAGYPADEQGRAQLTLEPPDQLAQRGSGQVQPLCGPAEMKLGGHRHERLKLPQFRT